MKLLAGQLKDANMRDAGSLGNRAKALTFRDGLANRLAPFEFGTRTTRRSASHTVQQRVNGHLHLFGKRGDDGQGADAVVVRSDLQGSEVIGHQLLAHLRAKAAA